MPKRKLAQHRTPLVVGAVSVVVLFAYHCPIERSFAESVSPSTPSAKNWSCLKRKDLLRDSHGRPLLLSSSELMDRIVERQPIERPGPLGKNSLRGKVTIQVVINRQGKVSCTHGVEGHPIAIAAAIESLYRWTFKPYTVKGKQKSVAGVLTLPYDFS